VDFGYMRSGELIASKFERKCSKVSGLFFGSCAALGRMQPLQPFSVVHIDTIEGPIERITLSELW